jgi:hypothetical protein
MIGFIEHFFTITINHRAITNLHSSLGHALFLSLYSPQLLKLTACLLLWNSVQLYIRKCSMDVHHRKHMSCNRYPASPLAYIKHKSRDCCAGSPLAHWLDLQKTWHVTTSHCCVAHCRHKENNAPVLLATCVLQASPSNGFTCHNNINLDLSEREFGNLQWLKWLRF